MFFPPLHRLYDSSGRVEKQRQASSSSSDEDVPFWRDEEPTELDIMSTQYILYRHVLSKASDEKIQRALENLQKISDYIGCDTTITRANVCSASRHLRDITSSFVDSLVAETIPDASKEQKEMLYKVYDLSKV